ncbi:General secretion pathway protein I [uncultured Candidatus Thioglobus sp.]|nr:General secretion pathway protein I [uncultured Candidatus Thioglobus sp.]
MNAKGFTLIEVLIALVIAAVALTALVKANHQSTKNIAYLEQKTLANLMLSNLSVEQRLGKKISIGYQSGEQKMGKQAWYWSSHTQPTPNKNIVKIDLWLYQTAVKRDAKKSIAGLVLYLQK